MKKNNNESNYLAAFSAKLTKTGILQGIYTMQEKRVFDRFVFSEEYELFSFITDLQKKKVKGVNGFGKWLNIRDEEIDLQRFVRLIHPGHRSFVVAAEEFIQQNFIATKPDIHLISGKWIFIHALRKSDGNYMLVKRIILPLKINSLNQVIEYLSLFFLIKEYQNEPFYMRVSELPDQYLSSIGSHLRRGRNKLLPFSEKEFLLMGTMIRTSSKTTDLAQILNNSPNTISTFRQRILDKARKYTGINFRNTDEVAKFLAPSGCLNTDIK